MNVDLVGDDVDLLIHEFGMMEGGANSLCDRAAANRPAFAKDWSPLDTGSEYWEIFLRMAAAMPTRPSIMRFWVRGSRKCWQEQFLREEGKRRNETL